MPIRGLILDLDDTLFDSRAAYVVATKAALGGTASAVFDAARAAVKDRLPAGHVAARNRWLYFKEALERSGKFSTRALMEMLERYEGALAAHLRGQWQRLGRQALLERLTARFPVVVLTNENLRGQILKLAAVDPEGRLPWRVIASEEVGVEKPDPRMLEAALARLKLPPADVCVVGNALDDDVRPALALGCRTVWTAEFEPGAAAAVVPAGVMRIKTLAEVEHHVA